MKLLNWYWFHIKRAVDLHEGRKNWLKERNSWRDFFNKIGSFAVVSIGIKVIAITLMFLVVGVYELLILFGMH